MKNTLGLNQSRMLCINSNQDEALKLVENPWVCKFGYIKGVFPRFTPSIKLHGNWCKY